MRELHECGSRRPRQARQPRAARRARSSNRFIPPPTSTSCASAPRAAMDISMPAIRQRGRESTKPRASVVGATLNAVDAVMAGTARRAFIPIAGLHHAARDGRPGFCVFNDCGVAIEILRRKHGLRRVAYVDIDAHHGDGVFYALRGRSRSAVRRSCTRTAAICIPARARADETGAGQARGTKLNIPLPPGAGDDEFRAAWSARRGLPARRQARVHPASVWRR